jgi:cellobiose-specific phosphotransferase system component IIB
MAMINVMVVRTSGMKSSLLITQTHNLVKKHDFTKLQDRPDSSLQLTGMAMTNIVAVRTSGMKRSL